MRAVYVVGLPQTGGCWLCEGRYYPDFDQAMAEVKKDREKGINSQVFTLRPKKKELPNHE